LIALEWRAGASEGELEEGRSAGELRAPEGEELVEAMAGQVRALPESIIGVLNGEVGQRRRCPLSVRFVELAQLAPENRHGPAITDDVMESEKKDVMISGEAQQTTSQHWPNGQIKGSIALFDDYSFRLRLALALLQLT
jgi:hypothetical protein